MWTTAPGRPGRCPELAGSWQSARPGPHQRPRPEWIGAVLSCARLLVGAAGRRIPGRPSRTS
eukprot:2470371-Pyramimonas_sp.AAC.1